MNKLDLRQIGTVHGVPIYIDLAHVIDHKEKGELLSSRDREEMIITQVMKDVFTPPEPAS